MTPFEVYRDYLALRNHFNSESYDYFKYQGKSSIGKDSFVTRKDRFFFEKVAKHKDPHNFMLANFVHNPKTWIRDMAYSEEAEQIYQDWVKRNQSLTYFISNEVSKLDENFDQLFIVDNNQHPPLLRYYLGNVISLETLCVLANITGCYKYWDKHLQNDVIWDQSKRFLRKYMPFVKFDKEKMKKMLMDRYGEKHE